MNTNTNIKQEISDLQKQIDDKIKSLQSLFQDGLRDLLLKHGDKVKSISMYCNNHEFNDGDATHYSLNYDDLRLVLSNDEEYDGYGKKDEELEKVAEEFRCHFASFDIRDFFENLYGGLYETASFRIEDGKLVV